MGIFESRRQELKQKPSLTPLEAAEEKIINTYGEAAFLYFRNSYEVLKDLGIPDNYKEGATEEDKANFDTYHEACIKIWGDLNNN